MLENSIKNSYKREITQDYPSYIETFHGIFVLTV